jgi:RNA polymerase sigma-70 factor (ECF subfamily)
VGDSEPAGIDHGAALLDLYDRAVPQVYGYLMPRCGTTAVAEDVTAETFLAAVGAVKKGAVEQVTVAWLVGIARHKLVDHWRREAREERKLRALSEDVVAEDDPWDEHLVLARAHEVLAGLGAHHRAALTLRYLDGLPVRDVAEHLGRSVHATEALLVRARSSFRRAYEEGGDGG